VSRLVTSTSRLRLSHAYSVTLVSPASSYASAFPSTWTKSSDVVTPFLFSEITHAPGFLEP
jgi:hypothetical protein